MGGLKDEIIKIIQYSPGLTPTGDTPSINNDFNVVIDDSSINVIIIPGSVFDLSNGVDDLYNRLFSIMSFYLRGKYQLYKKFKAINKIINGYTALSFPYRKGHYVRIMSDLHTVLSWGTKGIPLQLFNDGNNYTYQAMNPYASTAIDGQSRSGKTTLALYLMRCMLHLDPFNMGKPYSYVYAVDPKLSHLGLFLKIHDVNNATALVPSLNSGVGSDYLSRVNDLLNRLINLEKKRQKMIWTHSAVSNGVDWRSFQMKPVFIFIDEAGLLSKMASSKVLKVFRNRLDYLATTSQGYGIFLCIISQQLSVVNASVSTLLLQQCQNRIHCGQVPIGGKCIVPTSNLVMLPNEKYIGVMSLDSVVEPILLPTVR